MKQLVLDMGLPTAPTLANFVVGDNAAMLEHLQRWLRGEVSNVPTYLWGGRGSGKSHLLQAVASELLGQGARLGWLDATVHGERHFNESWSAILLDDLHCYTPVQQQQAFNWLINAQTQQCPVLATGEHAPVALLLRDDLRTRLGWGHVYGLQLLDEVAQREVLRQSAIARGLLLGDEVLDYMLKRFSRDLGSLMELLQQMDYYAMQTQRSMTIPLIKSMMDNA